MEKLLVENIAYTNAKVSVEFGLVALAHNLRKYIALGAPQRNLAHKKQEADPF